MQKINIRLKIIRYNIIINVKNQQKDKKNIYIISIVRKVIYIFTFVSY